MQTLTAKTCPFIPKYDQENSQMSKRCLRKSREIRDTEKLFVLVKNLILLNYQSLVATSLSF